MSKANTAKAPAAPTSAQATTTPSAEIVGTTATPDTTLDGSTGNQVAQANGVVSNQAVTQEPQPEIKKSKVSEVLIAKCVIPLGKKTYQPGEPLPEDLTDDQLDELKALSAI